LVRATRRNWEKRSLSPIFNDIISRMDRHPVEPGFEFVLDNRKLIVIFALLMAVCAGFFVFGFVEGKRQAVQSEVQKAPAAPTAVEPPPVSAEGNKVPSSPAPAAAEPPIRDQLEWYKNVKDRPESAAKRKETPARGKTAKKSEPTSATVTARPETKTPLPTDSSVGASPASKATYSVQVAAYRNRRDAEARAESLKSKGYEFTIEPSNNQENLYQLKVGRFDSRAEAAAMEARLKRDGFSTLIKKTTP
jgi:cell division protein FtsN